RKLGLSNSDGTPNELYRKFRNPASSGSAIAAAIKTAYAPLYIRNEFMHELSDPDLLGLVVEETGQAHDSQAVRLTVSCIKHLKTFARFNSTIPEGDIILEAKKEITPPPKLTSSERSSRTLGLNLGYTINLNLPATSDPEVFDAIFKSLKEHLL